jgi:peroxiredoxin Q/BCP
MKKTELNAPVPDFELPATDNKKIRLSALQGKNIVLYFYPKDDTPGCTRESQDFRDSDKKFAAQNTVIIGVSRDNLKSHEKFKCNHDLPFDLISDSEETLCDLFDVIREKNMYGKKVRGIERSTFLIDKNGILRREWRKVKVEEHVEEVLKAIREL